MTDLEKKMEALQVMTGQKQREVARGLEILAQVKERLTSAPERASAHAVAVAKELSARAVPHGYDSDAEMYHDTCHRFLVAEALELTTDVGVALALLRGYP